MTTNKSRTSSWPDYAAIWRWHFYAGLFCIPFVIWLSLTGSAYLFRPEIEAYLDRPYENLQLQGERPAPSAEVEAAVASVKGSHLDHYEPSATATGAAQVVVAAGDDKWRVYVDPRTLKPMKILRDEMRPMEVVGRLHGELLAGPAGSVLVEIAASWAIVLIITGLILWFPRKRKGFAGVLYPRLSNRGRLIWRDLHAVTGIWISAIMLFMLVSGLPWSVAWGNYLTWARELATATQVTPDWTLGGKLPEGSSAAAADSKNQPSSMPGMSAAEMAAMSGAGGNMAMNSREHRAMMLHSLDVVVPSVLKLHVPRPVLIRPPATMGGDWTVTSDNLDRLKRVTYTIAGADGSVTSRSGFADQDMVDKVVNVGISAHVGRLFGRLNQMLLLIMAVGLVTMMIGATVMWLKRKPAGLLGTPRHGAPPRARAWFIATIVVLTLLIPLFAVSLVGVLILERLVLRRVPPVRNWLGLASPAHS